MRCVVNVCVCEWCCVSVDVCGDWCVCVCVCGGCVVVVFGVECVDGGGDGARGRRR